MDKDVAQYLANLAAVRNHASTILNVGRGVIDQKMLHKVSARASGLDKLFVDVLMSGAIPGQKINPVVLSNQDDDIDIAARLAEAKKEVAGRKAGVKASLTETMDPVEDSDEDDSEQPEDEVAAFASLLASTENEINQKKSLNRPTIKGRRSK